MRVKTVHKKSFVFYILTTLSGIAFSFLFVLLSSFWIVKNDTDFEKYVIFLFAAAFFGAFISGFFGSQKQRQKRFLIAVGQGCISSAFFLLAVCMMDLFSVEPLVLFILPCGILGGAAAGAITSLLR